MSDVLHQARVKAQLSTEELARRAGIDGGEAAAIDAGEPAPIATAAALLVDLDRLAGALGLAGGVIEETLQQWAGAFAAQIHDTGSPPGPETGLPGPEDGGGHPGRAEAWLRTAVVAMAVALVGSAVVLGLARAGTLQAGPPAAPRASQAPPRSETPTATLLAPSAAGSTSASYVSPSGTLSLSFVASQPSWVEVRSATGTPVLAATVGPGTTAPISVDVPFTAQIGAGGTVLLVSAGQRSQTLTPPSAPFTFNVVAG